MPDVRRSMASRVTPANSTFCRTVCVLTLSLLLCQCPPPALAAKRRGGGGKRWQEGDVRLVGGKYRNQGTVLLYHEGRWGAVCDDAWDANDADVVCRQRGFPGSARSALKMEFGGRGRRRMWITKVNCRGTEERLLDCDFLGWGKDIHQQCQGQWRAVGVVCQPKPRQSIKPTEQQPMQPQAMTDNTYAAFLKLKRELKRQRRPQGQDRELWMQQKGARKAARQAARKRRRKLKQAAEDNDDSTSTDQPSTTTAASAVAYSTSEQSSIKVSGNRLHSSGLSSNDRLNKVENADPTVQTYSQFSQTHGVEVKRVVNTLSESVPEKNIVLPYERTTISRVPTSKHVLSRPVESPSSSSSSSSSSIIRYDKTSPRTFYLSSISSSSSFVNLLPDTKSTTTTTLPQTSFIHTTTTPSHTTATTTTTTPPTTTFTPSTTTTQTTTTTTTTTTPTTTTSTTTTPPPPTTTTTTQSTTEKTTKALKTMATSTKPPETIIDLSKVKVAKEVLLDGEGFKSDGGVLLQADSPSNPALELRLVGGRYSWEGRLEIRETEEDPPGPWVAICGAQWGMRETMVVCRELGMNHAKQPLQTNYFGGHEMTKLYYSFNCTGRENKLSECRHIKTDEQHKCPKATLIAGVVCSTYLPDLVPNLEELKSSVRLQDRPLYYLQCALEENCLSSSAYAVRNTSHWRNAQRRLLRFSTVVHNRGTADFRPFVAKGQWQWHACHMHFHSMEVFAHYDILDENGTRLAEGSKASFCLEDTVCDRGISRQFQCAGFGDQGLSVNCSDNYLWDIDCQWIDITDLKPGKYTFLMEINPTLMVAELNYDNNVARCDMWYSSYAASFTDCRYESLLDYRVS